MKKDLILAIDQGTTGSKVLIMDTNLCVKVESYHTFKQYFPSPGLVEHDLNDIWKSVILGIKDVSEKINTKNIISIGITNQRETICFWEAKSMKPLSKAIVWQDRRTYERCKELKKEGLEKEIRKKTGLVIDPYFSATKIEWFLKNNSLKGKNLNIGTIESFLIYMLSGGKSHKTEPSNASRTMVYDIIKNKWDDDLLKIFRIPKNILPEVIPSTGEFGKTKNLKYLPDNIPITGVLGDQQSALLGQCAIETGTAKCTYGTGAFVLTNAGSNFIESKNNLITTILWHFDKNPIYAIEGSAFMAGATIQWLRDINFIKKSHEIEALSKEVESSDGVIFVPSMTGLGAPHWDAKARGLICGITRGTKKGHIARASLEGICFQVYDILNAMKSDLKKPITQLNVDGGASVNNIMIQFQSDILNIKIKRPKYIETTSLGAIFASGLGIGIWNLDYIKKTWKLEKEFTPKISNKERNKKIALWNDAINRTKTNSN